MFFCRKQEWYSSVLLWDFTLIEPKRMKNVNFYVNGSINLFLFISFSWSLFYFYQFLFFKVICFQITLFFLSIMHYTISDPGQEKMHSHTFIYIDFAFYFASRCMKKKHLNSCFIRIRYFFFVLFLISHERMYVCCARFIVLFFYNCSHQWAFCYGATR
jgi:hypothetical protein